MYKFLLTQSVVDVQSVAKIENSASVRISEWGIKKPNLFFGTTGFIFLLYKTTYQCYFKAKIRILRQFSLLFLIIRNH